MQVLLVCFCRLYLRNHITLLADEAVRKHLKVDSTGSCTNSADANCIHVRHYKFIMFSPHHWHSMECVLLLQMSWRSVIYVCVFMFGTSGGGSQPPPHQIWGLRKRCKLSQRGPGRSLGRCKVFLHSRGAREPLLELVGGQVRRAWLPCPPPLKSAYATGRWHHRLPSLLVAPDSPFYAAFSRRDFFPPRCVDRLPPLTNEWSVVVDVKISTTCGRLASGVERRWFVESCRDFNSKFAAAASSALALHARRTAVSVWPKNTSSSRRGYL